MFKKSNPKDQIDDTIIQDECRTVEPSVNFRQITCHNCEHTAVYRFNTKQIRRNPKSPENQDNQATRDRWKSIPQFAEIPEVIKCENCGEILGSYPEIIY